jgi:NAD(P)-dependent dehydrogenase (short-subunit alcohol dehydrogenase family)
MTTLQDLQNKVFIVTGANSGIGYVAAMDFARRGAEVVLVCRSQERGEKARQAISNDTGNQKVSLYIADFSDLGSVSRLADALLRNFPKVHVLCNNAGAANDTRVVTADGFELTFAANHLAGFLLTQKLLPALLLAGKDGQARVVFTSSLGHFNSALDFADFNLESNYGTLRSYGRSKLMNLLTARELHRRYHERGLVCSSFHPGAVRTPIWSKGGRLASMLGIAMYPFMITMQKGADTLIWLAGSDDAAARNADGKYFYQRQRAKTAAFATDDAAIRLWDASVKLTQPFMH